jgi:hypothetical protein
VKKGDQIPCQGCAPEATGCETCGGYKFVLCVGACDDCGRTYWTRPGVYTSWEGKRYRSLDGLALVCRADGVRCVPCDEGRFLPPLPRSAR